MSRLGKIPVPIPEKVKVAVSGDTVSAEGPKGKHSLKFRREVAVAVEGDKVLVTRSDDQKLTKALHGTTRALVANLLEGVSKGYEKKLEINGVGYNARVQGSQLTLILGYSHAVVLDIPAGVSLECPSPTAVRVTGVDKHLVGQFAATIRRARPVEPYNLKGIKYSDEVVRKKAGKTFVTGAG